MTMLDELFEKLPYNTREALYRLADALECLNDAGVKYMVNLSLKQEDGAVKEVLNHNEDLSLRQITTFMQLIAKEYARREMIDSAANNAIVAMCINSSNKPEDFAGDWPLMNENYVVGKVLELDNGQRAYQLVGMRCDPRFGGYEASRFRILVSEMKSN